MTADDPRHGTSAGYKAHQHAGQPACRACTDAVARYQRGRDWDAFRGRPRRIDATGARRRLQALSRMGYPIAELVREVGMGQDPIQRIRAGEREWIRRSSHDAVARAYDRLAMTPGPSSSASIRAASRGWLPPLAWDNIDDPDERPRSGVRVRGRDVDEVVVDRILSGEFRLRSNSAERREVVRRWRKAGRSLADLERLTGWKADRYTKEAA